MAGQLDVHSVSVNVGTLAGTNVLPLFKNVSDNGSISILGAALTPQSVAGTGIWMLTYTPGSVGTAVYGASDGTICLFGSAANIGTAYRPLAGTAAATFPVVPANKWVCLEFAGTAGGNAIVSVSYVKGVAGA